MPTSVLSVVPHSTRPAVRRMTALAAVAGLLCAGVTGAVMTSATATEYGSPDVAFNTNVASANLGPIGFMVPLSDGGFVVKTSRIDGVGSESMRKIDGDGNEVQSYATTDAAYESLTSGVQVGDGGVVAIRPDRQVGAYKFDVQGQLVSDFRANYDTSLPAIESQVLFPTSDGGFLVGGFASVDGQWPRIVKKFYADGNERTAFRLNVDNSINGTDFGAATPDGGFVFVGDNDYPVPQKLDSNGRQVSSFSTNAGGAMDGEYPIAIDVLSDGTVVVATSNIEETELRLNAFDSAGHQVTSWNQQWPISSDFRPILRHTSRGHLLVSHDGTLREFDSTGGVVASSVSGIPATLNGTITAMLITADDQLLIGGTFTGSIKKYSVQMAPAPTVSSVAPATGPMAGGTSITITGTNFAAGASLGVSVGGVAATSVRVVSATQITAKTPAHAAGVANIVVTSGDGQTATLSRAFTFTAPAAPPPVTVLNGAAAKSAKVVTVASKVSGDFRAAPSISIVVGVGVAPVVKGLPANSSIKVDTSATFENRPTSDYQTIGTVRCDAKGALKIPAFKPSRVGSLNIRFTTSAGKHYYLKVQVTAR